MKNYIFQMLLTLMFVAAGVNTVFASDNLKAGLELVNYGEDALTYASGTITEALPKIGQVSHVTGDNQTIGNKRLLGRGDLIYVTFDDLESIALGEFFTLYRKIHEVRHPIDSRILGNLFKIVGVVEVIDIEQTPSIVKVHRSYSSIYPGDGIMPFVPPTTPEPTPGSELIKTEGMEGRIVDVPPSRTLIAQRHVVFIDWGQMEGMQRGDLLEVFRQRVGHPKKILGELKVLGVGEHTSSAMVTKSRFPILRGDQFVFKQAIPRQPNLVQDIEDMEDEESLTQEAEEPAPLEFVKEGDREILVVEGLLDHIEFDSGEARIKPEGVKILNQVSVALQEVPDKHIRVEGHTDNVEIGPTLQRKFPTNWELSNARATEVERFLRQDAGVKSKGMSNMGYASYLPVASNEDEEGRQKNRRVEIVLYSTDPTKHEIEGTLDVDTNRAKTEALNLITTPDQADPAPSTAGGDPNAEMMAPSMKSDTDKGSSTQEMREHEQSSMEKMAAVQDGAAQPSEPAEPVQPESMPSAGTSPDLPDLAVPPAAPLQ